MWKRAQQHTKKQLPCAQKDEHHCHLRSLLNHQISSPVAKADMTEHGTCLLMGALAVFAGHNYTA